MQPVFFDRFRATIERHGADAVQHPDTLLDSDGRHDVFYIPFEHVNGDARLAIVGITPGATQVALAYAKVQGLLRTRTGDAEILREAKREGSFGGDNMRPNLLRMLEAHGFPDILGIGAAADLWGARADLLYATSVVPHAAFVRGKPFADSFDVVMRSPALRTGFERDFVPSLNTLRDDILFIALGPTPLEALDWCARQGLIRCNQVIGAFAHPSSGSGSQVDVYLGMRDPAALKPRDPVKARLDWLLPAAARMRSATAALRSGRAVPPRPAGRPPKPAAAPTPRSPKPKAIVKSPEPLTGLGQAAFAAAGYAARHATKKVVLFEAPNTGRAVYLITANRSLKVVIDPAFAAQGQDATRDTGCAWEGAYNNSNMSCFPLHDNGSGEPIRYGFGIACPTAGSLEAFLHAFDA